MIRRLFTPFLMLLSATACFAAELTLPSVFSDHMVLQRDQMVPVWGKAAPGAAVTVEFAGQKKTVSADADGKWRVDLDPLSASFEPQELNVTSKPGTETSALRFSNVLVGEVWLCSGQSNMRWRMERTENGEAVIAEADHPAIRLYLTPSEYSRTPADTIDARWTPCTPETIRVFSGLAYYFGRKLNRELDVPIGLLQSAWGGTRIDPWIPPCGFEGIESLKKLHQTAQNMPVLPGSDRRAERQTPTAIYNAMIHAHIPFAIRGVIWYQGESNRRDGMLYVDKTRALLSGWRRLWGYDFPFYFVQIAPYQYGEDDPGILPVFWEAQAKISKTIPGTAMAVVSDYATLDDIHPPNKEVPGNRLALLALNHTYGKDIVSSGPVFRSLEKLNGELNVVFDHADGLTTRDGNPPDWFEVAGGNGRFKPAEAEIAGNTVVLSSDEVPNPAAVRFAWHKLATPNLINGAGLPAVPFRTK